MDDVLQKLRNARQQLNLALQTYSSTVTGLNFTFRSNAKTWNADCLDGLALEAQKDSSLVESGMHILRESRAILNQIRNKSLKRVPANRLPPEVLLEIIRLCALKNPNYYHVPTCSNHRFSPPMLFSLSHVCEEWRKIVLTTPSFWSHLDMTRTLQSKNLNNPLRCIQISVQRAASLPLCLDFGFAPPRPLHTVSALLSSELFFPYLNSLQIQSLYLFNSENNEQLAAVIARVFRSSKPELIQRLVVWRDDDHMSEPFIVGNPVVETAVASLRSPRVLLTSNLAFSWQNPVYQRGLVHLHLGGMLGQPETELGTDDLLSILSSCPELEILQLQQLVIWPSLSLQPQPVTLKRLKVLDLTFLPGNYLPILLPLLIIPASNPLSLKLCLTEPREEATFAFRDFLARIKVTRLFAFGGGPGEEATLRTYLTATKKLTTLIIHFNGSKAARYLQAISKSSVKLCPALCSLYLQGAGGTSDSIYDFVKGYPSLEKLCLIDSDINSARDATISRFKSAGLKTVEIYNLQTSFDENFWYSVMT